MQRNDNFSLFINASGVRNKEIKNREVFKIYNMENIYNTVGCSNC